MTRSQKYYKDFCRFQVAFDTVIEKIDLGFQASSEEPLYEFIDHSEWAVYATERKDGVWMVWIDKRMGLHSDERRKATNYILYSGGRYKIGKLVQYYLDECVK